METKMETNPDDFICQKCNKKYSNRSGLWKHINKNHPPQNSSKILPFPKSPPQFPPVSKNPTRSKSLLETVSNVPIRKVSNKNESNLFCKNCNKIFSRSDNLKRHLEICKQNNTNITDENEMLKQHIKNQEEMMNKLMDLINKNAKIHPKNK